MVKKIAPKICIALWMTLLLLLGVYYAGFAPRQSEYTETENRTLAGFPEFTAETLFSGQFGQEFETYLLDRFPLRDQAIEAVNRFQNFVSLASHEEYLLIAENVEDVLVGGDYQDDLEALLSEINNATAPPSTEPPVIDTTEPAVTEPPAETEPPEMPPIEPKPEVSPADFPQTLGVYMDVGGGEYRTDSYDRNSVIAITHILDKMAGLLPENGKLMFTVGPPSYLVNRFVNAEQKVSFYSTWDEAVNALSADNVYAFDAPEILSGAIQEGQYVAFRNDNHWTPRGAHLVYSQMASRAGKELANYDKDFDITIEEGFKGTYFRDNPSAFWSVEADTLELLMPKIPVEYRQLTGPDSYEVIDFLHFDAVSNDRYTVYLCGPGGPWRYVECDNGQTENCLVVTDSFGLTVIPFLTSNYKQVHYYDARYFDPHITGGSVSEMIEKYQIHDIYVIIADFHSFNSSFMIGSVNGQLGLN